MKLHHDHMQRCGCVVVAWCLTALTASAWGPDGHMIVGRIAEKHLTPRTAHELHDLLNPVPTDAPLTIASSEVVNWADDIRTDHPETKPWHFVDIPVDAARYEYARDCRAPGGCIITAIEEFRRQLADRKTDRATRIEALKYLVHFVGDIQMPLHCATRRGDKGGNMAWVRELNDVKATRLHAFWDLTLVAKNMRAQGLGAMAYADSLNRAVTAEQREAWRVGTPADWAWEAHLLAVKEAYTGIPVFSKAVTLDATYIENGQRIVAGQLTKAGLRLAQLLNDVCDPSQSNTPVKRR